jgi:hypothetical protein
MYRSLTPLKLTEIEKGARRLDVAAIADFVGATMCEGG